MFVNQNPPITKSKDKYTKVKIKFMSQKISKKARLTINVVYPNESRELGVISY